MLEEILSNIASLENEIQVCEKKLEEAKKDGFGFLIDLYVDVIASKQRRLKMYNHELSEYEVVEGYKKKIGRPSLGTRKTVCLTLPDTSWDLLEGLKRDTDKSLSAVLRDILGSFLITVNHDNEIALSDDFII